MESHRYCLQVSIPSTHKLALVYRNGTGHPHSSCVRVQVFACCDPEDYRKDFRDSEMHKLIDQYANSILLNITIPPPPRRRMREPGEGAWEEGGSVCMESVGGVCVRGEECVSGECEGSVWGESA